MSLSLGVVLHAPSYTLSIAWWLCIAYGPDITMTSALIVIVLKRLSRRVWLKTAEHRRTIWITTKKCWKQ